MHFLLKPLIRKDNLNVLNTSTCYSVLFEIEVDTLVVVGVETLGEVDTDDENDTDIDVETLDDADTEEGRRHRT